ncbi:hypothetical protein GX917_00115 [Candidatus Falkowbacteria bacterium]|jgi:uncharacterized membrane protein YukC|nr:hypothetical protein [Candidatus Falkowbacteria bacterium]
MLNNFEQKKRPRSEVSSEHDKRRNLSLNLHIMPQTVTGHWKKWLVLGLIILVVFAAFSVWLYFSTQ